MKTVKEVSKLTGVSIRTLHYYDKIGLLNPSETTVSGYRLYDDTALEQLQLILLFRELQFPLKEIRKIINSPDFDRNIAISQQITLLQMRREHIDNLITLARGIQILGVKSMDFSAFDTKKIDDYAAQAKASWGKTDAYREFEEKTKNRSKEEHEKINSKLMDIFKEFGAIRALSPDDDKVQSMVEKLRCFITESYYNCTPQIFKSLGKMYSGGGSFTEAIDKVGGEGTASLAAAAIDVYCRNLEQIR